MELPIIHLTYHFTMVVIYPISQSILDVADPQLIGDLISTWSCEQVAFIMVHYGLPNSTAEAIRFFAMPIMS